MNIRAYLIALILCAFTFSASAQSLAGLGAINGTVSDATGAVIPGAQVVVSNPNTGLRRALETNSAGLFAVPSLTPGTGYVITVTKAGFSNWEARDLQVQVGQNVSLNVTLTVGQQAQEITITDSTPVVDQLKTGISDVVGDRQILNLPINGRRVDSFVLLTPGVVADGTFGLLSFRGVPGGNAFLTDGNDTTQGYYNENAGRTRISSNISQDAVQEFQVQTSGYSAEFGRAAGGSVNTVTRSGANQTHGTGYWFFRNQDFNANDRYANAIGQAKPDETRNQFGGSIGGAIKKDKLFYFVNGDFTRRNFPLVSAIQNPRLFSADGTFIGDCGAPATPAQCAAAVNYFRRFFGEIPRRADQDTGFAKLDWRPNERNAFSLSFNVMNWISPNGIQTQATRTDGGGIGNNGDSTVRHRFARIAHTGIITPSLVNEFRFGWFKDRLFDTPNPALAPPNGLLGQLSVAGQGNLGIASFLPRVQPTEDRYQFANNLTWLVGRHNFKFGFDIAHTRDVLDLLNNQYGTFSYPSVTAFAQDLTNLDGGKRWQQYSQTFGTPQLSVFVRDYNFFAQDQWRVTNRLTINYGVRYEYAQFAQPQVFNPDYAATARINQPGRNFAPRVGFAYSLDQASKTVVRASYGLFFARMPGAFVGNLHQNNGVTQRPITLQSNIAADLALGPVFPNRVPSLDRTPPPGVLNVGFAAADLKTPYTQQWDFGIERELTRTTGVTVSYLGSRGIRFYGVQDLNVGMPTGSFTYSIRDAAGTNVGSFTTPTYLRANRVDQRYSRVTVTDNGNFTWYNAMVVQVRQRAAKWLEGSVNYTWSHAIDSNMGGGSSNLFFDRVGTLNNGDYRTERATSELDVRHRTVFTGLITPPVKQFENAFLRQTLNGWNLSFIGTLSSAPYSTPTVFVSGTQFTGPAFNNTLNGLGGSSRVPFMARTSVPIDNIRRVDARLTKAFRISERVQTMFNFEVFNVFNRISDTSVASQAYEARSGVLTPVSNFGVGVASQGFPDGTNARRAQISLRVVF